MVILLCEMKWRHPKVELGDSENLFRDIYCEKYRDTGYIAIAVLW